MVDRPATTALPSEFYLISGLGIVDMENDLVSVCAGHIFSRSSQLTPDSVYQHWFQYEELVIGTDAVSDAIDRLANELRARVLEPLKELVAKFDEYDLR